MSADAVAVFQQFYEEMNQWVRLTKKMDNESYKGLIDHQKFLRHRITALVDIFGRYVIYNGSPMRMEEGGFHYDPHEYKPDRELVTHVEVTPTQVRIYTERGVHRYIYILVLKDDRWWLLDGREHTFDFGSENSGSANPTQRSTSLFWL